MIKLFLGGVLGIAITLTVLAVFYPPSPFHYYSKQCIISDLNDTWQVYCQN